MKRNESAKSGSLYRRAILSSDGRHAKYPHPDEALMAPLTLRHELNDGGVFHLRAEISFAHLGTCRRRPPSAVRRRPDERAQIERILTRTLKRKRFTVALDELTATRSIICYCVIAITRCLLTTGHLNIAHAYYRRPLENFNQEINRREEKTIDKTWQKYCVSSYELKRILLLLFSSYKTR